MVSALGQIQGSLAFGGLESKSLRPEDVARAENQQRVIINSEQERKAEEREKTAQSRPGSDAQTGSPFKPAFIAPRSPLAQAALISLQEGENAQSRHSAVDGQKAEAPQAQIAAQGKVTSADKSDKPQLGEELTEEEEKQVQDLKKRDAEVRAHEQAHAAVGGSYASAPSYEFQTGPDNKQYAVGGEVQIDSAPIPNNPEATIRKLDIVIRAALAPAEPSPQDIRVASEAQKNRAAAQAELAKQRQAERDAKSQEAKKGAGTDPALETSQERAPLTAARGRAAAQEQAAAQGQVKNEQSEKNAQDASEILAAILAYKS